MRYENTALESFVDAVRAERARQQELWGDDFDGKNTANDWVAYLASYIGRAVTMPWNRATFVASMVKVATLCAAASEWAGRGMAPRHYDDLGPLFADSGQPVLDLDKSDRQLREEADKGGIVMPSDDSGQPMGNRHHTDPE